MKKIIVAVAILFLAGCNMPSTKNLQDQLIQTQSGINQLKTQLDQQQAASTQPNATQAAPSAALVKAVNDAKVKVDQLATAVGNLPPDANPGNLITAAAPLTGPAAPFVMLAGVLVSFGWGLWQRSNSKTYEAALATTIDGLNAAIATKAITVAPTAPAIVNAAVIAHPATDKVVDMLSDASGTARIY